MKKIIHYLLLLIFSISTLIGCKFYSFTGATTDAETIQIDFFPNQAPLIEPTLSQRFTQDLQDLFTRQTNLTLVPSNGELYIGGEITAYRVTPMSASSNQTSAQNRLTITVNVRFVNKKNEKDDFEKQFSFYADFDGSAQLTGSVLENAFDEIIERITQDIFNATVAKW